MKHALVLSCTYPRDGYQSVHGIFRRMSMFLSALRNRCERVTLLIYVEPELAASPDAVQFAEDVFEKLWGVQINISLCPKALHPKSASAIHYYFDGLFNAHKHDGYRETSGPTQIKAFEDLLQDNPDLIFIHRLQASPPALLSTKALPPIFLDLDDIEHKSKFRQLLYNPRWKSERIKMIEIPSLALLERRSVRLSNRTFVCSTKDQDYLNRLFATHKVAVIQNSIDVPNETIPIPENNKLLFLGMFRHPPNAQAAEHLITKIWPIIYVQKSNAELIIAGKCPELIPSYGKTEQSIRFTGFVDNLGKLYTEAQVVCCPILTGGGTRLKIIEAAAYNRPIVSTTIGCEGLDLVNDREIFMRDNDVDFAEACIALFKSHQLCTDIGLAAKNKIGRLYDRQSVIAYIEKVIFDDSL